MGAIANSRIVPDTGASIQDCDVRAAARFSDVARALALDCPDAQPLMGAWASSDRWMQLRCGAL
jgi:hypothetical protein